MRGDPPLREIVSTSGCPSGSLWKASISPSGDQRAKPGSEFNVVN